MGGSERAWSLMCPFEHVVMSRQFHVMSPESLRIKKSPVNVSYRAGEGVAVSMRGSWCVRLGTLQVCPFGRVAGVSHRPFVIVLDGVGVVPVLACSLFDSLAFNVVLDWLMIRPDPTASASSSAWLIRGRSCSSSSHVLRHLYSHCLCSSALFFIVRLCGVFVTVYGVVGFSTTVKLGNLELGIEFRAHDTHLLCICLVIAARLRFLTPETPLPQVSQKNKKTQRDQTANRVAKLPHGHQRSKNANATASAVCC